MLFWWGKYEKNILFFFDWKKKEEIRVVIVLSIEIVRKLFFQLSVDDVNHGIQVGCLRKESFE